MNYFLKHYAGIADKKDDLVQTYFDITKDITKELDENGNIIDTANKSTRKELKVFLNKIQDFYDKLSELQYRIQRFDDIIGKETANYTQDDGNSATIYIRAVNESLKSWLSMIQFRYLTPITITMSEFDVKASYRRDARIFAYSVILSSIIGFAISWYFDKANDSDIKEFKQTVIQNQDTIKTKLDNQTDLINQNTILLDSLILKKNKNGANNH